MDNLSVIDQLHADMDVFGIAYYTVDDKGKKTRINPLTLVIMKKDNNTVSIEQRQAFHTKLSKDSNLI